MARFSDTIDREGIVQRLPGYRRSAALRVSRALVQDPRHRQAAWDGVNAVLAHAAVRSAEVDPLAKALGTVEEFVASTAQSASDLAEWVADGFLEAMGFALDAVAAPVRAGVLIVGEALDLCAHLVPREYWMRVYVHGGASDAGELETALRVRGFALDHAARARHGRTGVCVIELPPIAEFVDALAELEEVRTLADGGVVVGRVPVLPMRRGGSASDTPDVARLLNVPSHARENLGANVRLAVLDTGVDRDHVAFTGQFADEGDYILFGGSDYADRQGHGTHVCGIAAGRARASDGRFGGVAPHVSLVAAKVFDDDGTATLDAVVEGLTWAHETARADIASLSLGASGYAPGESVVSQMCQRLTDAGMLVVAAAGNEGPGWRTVGAPGDVAGVLTVGAVDAEFRVARFSSRGARDADHPLYGKPNVVAPGVRIVAPRSSASSLPGFDADDDYTVMDGTSMACPAIAGAAALVLSELRRHTPEVGARVAAECLVASARAVPDVHVAAAGAGVPDVARALELARQRRDIAEPVAQSLDARDLHAVATNAMTEASSTEVPVVATATAAKPRSAEGTGTIARDVARSLELEFLNGFEARFYTLSALANPLDGKTYPIHAEGEAVQVFSERETLRGMLREAPDAGDLRAYPHNKHVELTVVRRKLFGAPEPKMVVAGACLSPLAELVAHGEASAPADRADIARMTERIIQSPDTFYYIGLFSTTGWARRALAAIPQVRNARVFLLDCHLERGFRIYAPASFDAALRRAFDPEDDETKRRRVLDAVAGWPELGHGGGLVLIEEIAERCNVPESVAISVATELAARDDSLETGTRKGRDFLRRQRFATRRARA